MSCFWARHVSLHESPGGMQWASTGVGGGGVEAGRGFQRDYCATCLHGANPAFDVWRRGGHQMWRPSCGSEPGSSNGPSRFSDHFLQRKRASCTCAAPLRDGRMKLRQQSSHLPCPLCEGYTTASESSGNKSRWSNSLPTVNDPDDCFNKTTVAAIAQQAD